MAAASFLAGEAACAPQGLRAGVMPDSKRVGGYCAGSTMRQTQCVGRAIMLAACRDTSNSTNLSLD